MIQIHHERGLQRGGARETRRARTGGIPIHPIDLALVILFLAAFTGFGLWRGRGNRTAEDYFLGARSVPWIVAMLSIVATETSVLTFVSVPGLAYRGDWFLLELAAGYILGRVGVSLFLLPAYFREGVTSIYELLGKRFSPGVQKAASAVFLATRVLADGVRFLATAVIVQALTGWSLPAAVLVLGGVTLLYTLAGGIRTVAWVDAVQFGVYLGGALLCLGVLLHGIDLSPGAILERLWPEGKLRIFRFAGNPLADPWNAPAAVLGGAFFSLASHGADHMMVQRALLCRNLRAGRAAMVGSGFLAFFQFAVFLSVGSLMYLYFHGKALPKDREFATFIANVLPPGVRGLLFAGILAAAMSTLSSSVNALAASSTTDWFQTSPTLARSRGWSLAWGLVLMVVALAFRESDRAFVELGLEIASVTYGGLLGLFLLARSKRACRSGAAGAGLLGAVGGVLLLKRLGLAWTWFTPAGAGILLATAFLWERGSRRVGGSS